MGFEVVAPAHDLACVVDCVGRGARPSEVPQIRHVAGLPQDPVAVQRIVPTVADDRAPIVEPERFAIVGLGEGPQVRHRAIVPEERPRGDRHRLGRGGEAVSHHPAGVVDAEGDAVIVSRQGPQVPHRAVVPQEGVTESSHRGVAAEADDLARVVDGLGLAQIVSAERPQVRHRAVVPQEGVVLRIVRVDCSAHHLAAVVDSPAVARPGGPEASQVRHGPVGPQERVRGPTRRRARPDDLTDVVDAISDADGAAQGPKVDDVGRGRPRRRDRQSGDSDQNGQGPASRGQPPALRPPAMAVRGSDPVGPKSLQRRDKAAAGLATLCNGPSESQRRHKP